MIPSIVSPPPVTPPVGATRPPLTPKVNQAHGTSLRRYPFIRRAPQSPMTPQHHQSFTQANARVMHEHLQQHHTKLQVQLQSTTTPAQAPPPSVKAFLDSTLRAYAARFQTELVGMRTACMQLVQREERKSAEMRDTCARLAQERDVAQEKLRVLLERRKRTRSQVEAEEAEAAVGLLQYPPPPTPISPQQLPTQSPPPRLLSPFVLAVRRSPPRTPDPEDRTTFDLTVGCDELPLPRVSKRRRVSESEESERTLVVTPEPEVVTKVRETCPPAPPGFELGECDMDLETDSEAGSECDTRSSFSPKLRPASNSPPRLLPQSTRASPMLTPPPSAPLEKARLDLGYVDIMYLPTNGKLVCRVCLLAASSKSNKSGTGAIQAFIPGASWEMLRIHCEEAHPEACRDVVGLGPQGVRELRRRLGLGVSVLP
ncbi:hypothetical protein FB45DRAFT_1031489 [Roridomyces roridus]|uniref:Uncharacterized protein n=1 Tax=Roridomyces roridus TaxID=1738132 RepID=A0AAD7BKJ0_9AGAR|nr:hypothetical protein FB45DRAFT_1031489 [Roridomyces roridus]